MSTVTATQDPQIQELRALQASVPPIIAARYPEIIHMLFETPSLTFEEKKYWFQLLPLMTGDQIQKLKDILVTERERFVEIQKKFSTTEAPKKPFEVERIRAARKERILAEQTQEKNEASTEEAALLKELHQL